MIGGLVRLVLVALVVVAAGFFLFGYWSSGRFDAAPAETTSAPPEQREGPADVDRPGIDKAAAREAGAEIGEKAALAAARVSESLEEGSLTAKIKAKMVLDDLVKARAINVTTDGTAVTLTGTVHSPQERDRALDLARETDGVTRVVDQLVVR
jgi:hyperosmotically inducible protein